MVQNIAALHLQLQDSQVRVVCKDVGGSFGIKVHIYADEMATYALSKLLRRPIKFVADRVESFNTDIHARDHRCKGRIGVKHVLHAKCNRGVIQPAAPATGIVFGCGNRHYALFFAVVHLHIFTAFLGETGHLRSSGRWQVERVV